MICLVCFLNPFHHFGFLFEDFEFESLAELLSAFFQTMLSLTSEIDCL